MKIRIPLYLKIVVPMIVLIVITVGYSGYRVFKESTQRWQTQLDARLKSAAEYAASGVNIDTLKLLHAPTDIDTETYEQMRQYLEQITFAGNLEWMGIYYRDGDMFYYWADSGYTGVSSPFFYATAEHLAAYEDMQSHRTQYSDEYGSWYGFVAPIIVKDENGQPQVLGLVEALNTAETRNLLQQDTLNNIMPILVGGSVLAVVLSLLLAIFTFNRPLLQLQHGALALAKGKFGYTIDLKSNDELGELADTFNLMSTQLEQLYLERTERERMQRELEIAHNVQQALFPSQLPQVPGLEVAAFCRPHRETSGDFYDLLVVGETRLGIVVGDVSGKSIPAAMLMVAAHSAIRSEAFDHPSPAEVLDQSNVLLCRDVPRGMFVAASYAAIDGRTREMVWANAGQIYPFLLHRVRLSSEQYPRYLETTGMALPLGMEPTVKYQDQRQALQPGDTVLFYTDGVVEAMNHERELYGFERLEALVQSLPQDLSPQALIDAVLADVAGFVGPAEQHDDITIVAVKVT